MLGCRVYPFVVYASSFLRSKFPISTVKLLSSSNEIPPSVSGEWVPGPKIPSTWWPPQPKVPGRRVVRMYPIKFRHRPRIVLVREGCTNRPFYTIQVRSNLAETKQQGIEQLGSWDPFPNKDHGEQLVSLNLDRISYWLAHGAEPTDRVAELLGLAGFLPIHPRSYLAAHRARLATRAYLERQKEAESPTSDGDVEEKVDRTGEDDVNPSERPDSIWCRGKRPSGWWRKGLV